MGGDRCRRSSTAILLLRCRCPKCQNNSIADSNAVIVADMRLKVYELMKQSQSRQQIIDYMVSTLILWDGPALFALLGG